MKLGIKDMQIKERELQSIYYFLETEGLSYDESVQLMSTMDDIYRGITLLKRPYSISEFSLQVKELFDDNFFDNNFIACLLEEASKTSINWGSLYPKLDFLDRDEFVLR